VSAEGDIRVRQQGIVLDRNIGTQIDQFRASEFINDVISGATNYTSGFNLLTITTSNVAKIRPLNIHFQNRETSAMTVVFRDGGITGGVVAGPYIINPTSQKTVPPEELQGRSFVSSIYPVVISGVFAQGIPINIGFIIEASDYFE
jgi:hypothetical protein